MAKIIFVSSPFSGNVERNIIKARDYCRYVVDQNHIPLAPHLLFPQFMDDSNLEERSKAIGFGLALLKLCDEVWIFGDTISSGMEEEIEFAKQINKTIKCLGEIK